MSPTATPSPSGTGPVVPPGQAACPPVLLYGARGAGESGTAEDGLGSALYAYRQRLRSAFGTSGVGSAALSYPAAAVADPASAASWQADAVRAAVTAGARTAVTDITTFAAACPSSTILLGGRDEGALVLREAIAALPAAALSRVANMILIADPAFSPSDAGRIVGSGTTWNTGVLAAATDVAPLPDSLNPLHVCNGGDALCQSGSTLPAATSYDSAALDVAIEVASTLAKRGVRPALAVVPHMVAPGPVQAGGRAVFTVNAVNVGTAANVVAGELSVTYSAWVPGTGGVARVEASGDGWTCTSAQAECVRNIAVGAFAAGAALPPISVSVEVPARAPSAFLSVTSTDLALGGVQNLVHAEAKVPVIPVSSARVHARVTSLTPDVSERVTPRWAVQLVNSGDAATSAPVEAALTATVRSGLSAVELTAAGDGWVCLSGDRCLFVPVLAPGARSSVLLVTQNPLLFADRFLPGGVQLDVVVVPHKSGADAQTTTQLVVPVALSSRRALAVDLAPVATVTAGSHAAWSMTVRNPSAVATKGTISAKLDASNGLGGSEIIGAIGDGWVCAGNECAWTKGALLPGRATPPLTVTVQVGVGDDVANVTATARDTGKDGLRGASASASYPVIETAQPHLQPLVQPASGTAPLLSGVRRSWKVTLVNTGAAASRGSAALRLGLPGSVRDWTVAGTGWSCASAICTTTQAVAAGGASTAVTITEKAAPAPSVDTGSRQLYATVDAAVAGGGVGGASARSTITSTGPASGSKDLAVLVTAPTGPVTVGASATTTVVVRNVGSQPVTGAAVDLELDGRGVSGYGSGWTCEWTCTTDAVIAPGASAPLLTLTLPTGDRNLFGESPWRDENVVGATLRDWDQTEANNRATASIVVADPTVDLVPSLSLPPSARLGQALTGTVTVRNAGSKVASGEVLLELSAGIGDSEWGMPVQAVSGAGWTCAIEERVCTHPGPVPAGGALPPVTVTAVPQSDSTGTSVEEVRMGAVLTSVADQKPATRRAARSVPVAPGSADIVATVTPSGQTPSPGTTTTSKVTLRNAGTEGITEPTVVHLEAERAVVEWVRATGPGWSCVTTDGDAKCTTNAAIAGGATLPPLSVVSRTSTAADDGSAAAQWLRVSWENPGDRFAFNNLAWSSTSVARRSVDLVPVVQPPAGPQSAGAVGAPSTSVVTAAVRNAGRISATGAIRLTWDEEAAVVTAMGSGWTCAVAKRTCVRAGGLGAGATTPSVSLGLRNVPGAAPAFTRVTVSVAGAQDGTTDADAAIAGYVAY